MSDEEEPAPEALLGIAEDGVRRAQRGGAEEVEVFLWHAAKHKAEHAGSTTTIAESDQSGVGVRVALGRRVGLAMSSGTEPVDVAWAVDTGVRSAARGVEDPLFKQFPDPAVVQGPASPVDPAVQHPDPARLIADARAAGEVLAAEPGVTYFSATLTDARCLFAVANSRGVAAWDRDACEAFSLEIRATGPQGHRVAKHRAADRHPLQGRIDLAGEAKAAARRASEATSPSRLEGFVHDVIFDAASAMPLVEQYAHAFSASMKAHSRFADKVGQQVASPLLTLREEPRGAGCRRQRVDDEGVPTAPRALVQDGVLQTFLYDTRSALREGRASTGSGLRPLGLRYAGSPMPRAANAEVAPGRGSLDEMVAEADRAVLVRDALMGTFAMNRVTGDFSFVAPAAYFVERGEVRHALVPTTVAGNLYEAMANVVAVGREQERYLPGACPPLRIRGLTCAT